MAHLRIEMDRGSGWNLRSEGIVPNDITVERIEHHLRTYAVQYPHRALLNGAVVASAGPDDVSCVEAEAAARIAAEHVAAFDRLTFQLRLVADHAARAHDAGRGAAVGALGAAILFLRVVLKPGKQEHLLAPLLILAEALADLDVTGTQHLMFAPKVRGHRLSTDRARLQAAAAALSQTLQSKGKNADEADKLVAEGLDEYRTRAVGDARAKVAAGSVGKCVSPATIREWRRQARQPTPSGVDADQYRHCLELFAVEPPDLLLPAVLMLLRQTYPHLFIAKAL